MAAADQQTLNAESSNLHDTSFGSNVQKQIRHGFEELKAEVKNELINNPTITSMNGSEFGSQAANAAIN